MVNYMSTREAVEFLNNLAKEGLLDLNINKRKLRRLIDRDHIKAEKDEDGYYQLEEDDIWDFVFKKEAYSEFIDDKIDLLKEFYVIREEGATVGDIDKQLLEYCEFDLLKLEKALDFYSKERPSIYAFRGLDLSGEEFFSQSEILARLRSNDQNIFRLLFEKGYLEKIHEKFISRDSFFKYIKNNSKSRNKSYLGRRLYRSHHVRDFHSIPINNIDKIANRKDIGRKIIPGKDQSNYLFDCEDIEHINEIYSS